MNEWQIVAAPPELRIREKDGNPNRVILLAIQPPKSPQKAAAPSSIAPPLLTPFGWKTYALCSIREEKSQEWIKIAPDSHYLFFPEDNGETGAEGDMLMTLDPTKIEEEPEEENDTEGTTPVPTKVG